MSNALSQLQPLLALTGVFLVGFAGIALWQVRRAVRDLGMSEQLRLDARARGHAHRPAQPSQDDRADRRRAGRPRAGEVVTLALPRSRRPEGRQRRARPSHRRRSADGTRRAAARHPAGRRAFCGRFDGDEFAVVMTSPDAAIRRSRGRRDPGALSRPFWINEQAVQVGVTAGLAHAPRDARARDDLMRRADLALRAAKKKQRGGVVHFEPAMDADFDDRRFIEKELRRALDEPRARRPLPADRVGRRQRASSAPRRCCAGPIRFAAPSRRHVRAGRRAVRADGPAWRIRAAPRSGRRHALAGIYMSVNLSPVQVRDPALVETRHRPARQIRHAAVPADARGHRRRADRDPGETSAKLDRLKIQPQSRGPLAALGAHRVEEPLHARTGRFSSSCARLGVARIQARCD